METITGYKKEIHNLKPIYKKIENSPKVRHQYINGELWIFGIGNLYQSKEECDKKRDKKYERLHIFKFFNIVFYGNVAKYDYKKIIKQVTGK